MPHLPVRRLAPGVRGGCSFAVNHTVDAEHFWLGWLSPRPISTGRLNTLPCLHLRPINPIVSREPYPLQRGGIPHLEASCPLRCFQRLSLPNVANQPCPWRDNWHTRGSSVPVLSY